MAGAGILALAIFLTGISCSKEQPKEKAVLPSETAPQQTTPLPDQGKMAERPGMAGIPHDTKGEVIARVNGTDIMMSDLSSEMKMIGPQVIKDPGQRTPENIKRLKETAFDILIFRELATQEAARQGMKVRKEAVEEADQQLRTKLGSEQNYRKFLEMSGYNEASMRRRLEKDMLFEMITDKEIFKKAGANNQAAIEKRKAAWESSLKKNAKIEIFLPEAEKDIMEEAKKK